MRKVLFRKLVIDGVNYYQIYKVEDNFELNDDFADFSHRTEKDFFYLENDEIDESFLYSMFYDNNGEFEGLTFDDRELFIKVFNAFKDKFQDIVGNLVVKEIKSIDEIVDKVDEKILFQKENVRRLVSQIYQNQEILASNLPDEVKIKLKSNILFHGMVGTGKNTIVDILEDELGIPYADVKITTDLRELAENIVRQLLSKSKNQEEATNGIVFVRDNFDEIINIFDGDEEKAYMTVDYLTRIGKVRLNDNLIDFSKLTFVVLLNRGDMIIDQDDLMDTMSIMGCFHETSTDPLTVNQKYLVLLKDNGRINIYKKFLDSVGIKFIVEDKALKKLIKYCTKREPGMKFLNSAIDVIIKKGLKEDADEICIDIDNVNSLIESLSYDDYDEEDLVKEDKEEKLTKKEIYNKVIETVVGQDEHVKRNLYTIMENQRMANDMTLENPKKYIDNILIRGESGSGKTLIIETISKLLNIPFYSADATQFTEAGYKGADVEDMLVGLLHNAGDDKEKAQKGILDIDEIDKKAGYGNNDVSRGAVQNGLLKIVEGSIIPINVGNRLNPEIIDFDTSRLTIIGKGAFEGIENLRDDRIRKATGHTLGFNNEEKNDFVDKELTDDDFVKYGMQRQFMARLPIKIELNKNSVDTLKEIMLKSKISALKIQKYKLESHGIEVEYTSDFYDELAKYAYNMKIGARGIEKAIQKVLTSIHIEDIEPGEVSKIIFTGEVVSDPSKIVIIKRENETQKVKMKTR